jgi:protein-S-isoprenylcysteine O-methyltransferase Ste14
MYILSVFVICFFVVWLIWLYTDPRPFRFRLKGKILLAYAVMFLIVLPQVLSYLYFPLPNTSWDMVFELSGVILFVAGLGISIWAKLTMRKYWGPPGEHDIKRQDTLLTHGPFAYSRNPIYLGMFLLVFGFALALRSVFVFLPVIMMIYFTKEAMKEERLLHRHFGEKYDKYKEKVPRFIGLGKLSL